VGCLDTEFYSKVISEDPFLWECVGCFEEGEQVNILSEDPFDCECIGCETGLELVIKTNDYYCYGCLEEN